MTPEEAIKEIIAEIDSQERNYRPAIPGYAEIRAPLVELAHTARKIASAAGIEVVITKEKEMESEKKKVDEDENESNSNGSEATDSDNAEGATGPGILDPTTDPGVGSGPPEPPPEPPPQGGGN